MADSENNIPTLTDISHQGNVDMLNHFDAHQFEPDAEETENIITLENASEIENESIISNEEFLNNENVEEIPSITIEEPISSDIESENFSDSMQSVSNKTTEIKFNNNELKEKIDLAITKALSGIEIQLKEKLYKEFDI